MTSLDLSTIQELLSQERKVEDDKSSRAAKVDAFYRHHFDKKFLYLLNMSYEQMFVPEKSTSTLSKGRWHCLACAAIGIKNRESHFNWHKRELHE